jgi:cell division septal protein FtsQ
MSYRKKAVKNKIHKNKPKKSILKMPIFWWSLLVLILVITALYFLLFCPKFQIQNIIILGNEKINSQDLQRISENSINKKIINLGFWSLSSKSIFLASINDIKNQIFNFSPTIKAIDITKTYPQNLNIQVQERKRFAIFCQNEKCFDIDDTGIIFEELSSISEDKFIVRQELDVENAYLGKEAVLKKTMEKIIEIKKNFADNLQISLLEVTISTPIRLNAKTREGWQAFFDIAEGSNISLQLTKLNLLLKDEINLENRQKLEYIDLRFEDRAYYK